MKTPFQIVPIVLLMLVAGCTGEASSTADQPAATPAASTPPASRALPMPPKSDTLEIAIVAGGCFWCVETQFEGVPGVHAVISGFTGGKELNPTYEQVSSGGTGHFESVEIQFDPRRVTYSVLMDMFWRSIDPTQGNGQFCDHGTQYRSAIFWTDSTQLRIARESQRKIEKLKVLKAPIVTQILKAGPFYAAEEYHQDFWKKDPERYHSYREGCGRDARLRQLWGKLAAEPTAH